ncbi:hypothetical protein ACFXHA_18835 [Nocardia sp. NPDC059240]|uniref:hypothetical protein n=1 Tax=Nocardia sp. NPDC059240 TaxID=3346786 RepID=UPI0036855C3A
MWKSPIALIIAAVVALLAVVGVVFAVSVDDSTSNGAAASSAATPLSTSSTGAPSTTRTSAKPTTTSKAPVAVPPAVQPIVDALPMALRQAVLQHDIRAKPADDMLGYDAAAGFTLGGNNPLVQGLMHFQSNDNYAIAYISTQPDTIRRIWGSQQPEWTTDEGTRLVRIDPGNTYSEGTATLEVFVPQSNLYFELPGFQSVDAAKQFMQRAGF